MRKTIGTITFPAFCILLSLFVLLTDQTFTYALLEEHSIIPTKQVFKYFEGREELPELFNADEKSHLADVKNIILGSFAVFVLLAIAQFYSITRKTVVNGSILLIVLLAAVLIVPFDTLFEFFHKIFFPQGNWTFPADSIIIMLYPYTFFVKYAIAIAANSLIAAGIFAYIFVSKKE